MQSGPKPATLRAHFTHCLAARGERRLADIYIQKEEICSELMQLRHRRQGFKEERKIDGFKGHAGI